MIAVTKVEQVYEGRLKVILLLQVSGPLNLYHIGSDL